MGAKSNPGKVIQELTWPPSQSDMMINLMSQLDWATGLPESGSSIILGVSLREVSNDFSI